MGRLFEGALKDESQGCFAISREGGTLGPPTGSLGACTSACKTEQEGRRSSLVPTRSAVWSGASAGDVREVDAVHGGFAMGSRGGIPGQSQERLQHQGVRTVDAGTGAGVARRPCARGSTSSKRVVSTTAESPSDRSHGRAVE